MTKFVKRSEKFCVPHRMIPRYRSPFGFSTIVSGLVGGCFNISISSIEEAYANHFHMPYSVLLPSCRAGMSWALEINNASHKNVLCSAFNCPTVFEAILRAGSELVIADIEHDSFLLEHKSIKLLNCQSLVLSEIYGYTYDLNLWALTDSLPGIRIIDMAMTVPSLHHFQRLRRTDFAVLSFGTGKCLYAGSGGIGFSHDKNLVREVRKWRDKCIEKETLLLFIKHSLEILSRSIIREPALYGFYFKRSTLKRLIKDENDDGIILDQLDYVKQPLSKEWYTPTTYIDRYLMFYNLKCASGYIEKRIAIAKRYRINLNGVDGLILPPISSDALSHYTIRVNHHLRDKLIHYLFGMGIETGTLFFFSRLFNRRNFPNAASTAAEIINLPIDVRMLLSDVDRICNCLLEALKQVNN
ncbi:MAG: UDP-4-amino-4-deoxy-L-arabinose--oxoglutarate aminotransferase [Deltaproteobacteria bacterium ADurb.Bin151]|nr:MAG: UDP-4-amino-4-deoxy-L-arabinose--oxoglutarate aminotransferase [Deltaproteobacteria bacterium ADurb.Bin151]